MIPTEFVAKWKAATLTERAASQSHFLDLCHLLDEPSPAEADPTGEWYAFERGANKTTGAKGWADVWKRNHFAWEYKGKGRDLDAAFAQLQQYAGALGNPPLLVVSDMQTFRIHTAWTNTVSEVHRLTLDDMLDAGKRRLLKWVLSAPAHLRPGLTRQKLTEQAAGTFADLARRLRGRGHDSQRVAHFVNRLVFCMFAEDVDLLPNKMFQRTLEACYVKPDRFESLTRALFAAMRTGGDVGIEAVEWFNGGLFDDDASLPLTRDDLGEVLAAARLEWAEIDPSIFGTLFERGLDPDKRSQLGAHYTDRDKIRLIIEPVVTRPLLAEWEACKAEIADALAKTAAAKAPAARTKARKQAETLYRGFLDRLRAFRVLDPACGSGNFLYLALLTLKDLEHRAGVEAEAMGLHREFPAIGPDCVKGIEINPYAAELARISVWIGEIQWMRRNGYNISRNPILRPLDTIENRDALFPADPAAPWPDPAHLWPQVDAIIGNPPFLGDKMMIGALGEDYVARLRRGYADWLPGGSDLVCYWFAIADRMLRTGRAARAGFVATNSIRGGANRRVLEAIREHHVITDAWADEAWTVDGAAVRVSLVCFGPKGAGDAPPCLDGVPVVEVFSDLTSGGADLTVAAVLSQNKGTSFIGRQKDGPIDVPGDLAREWLKAPANPNGKPNSDVVHPWMNGADITRRPTGRWLVDFKEMDEDTACLYETPFEYLRVHLKPLRAENRDRQRRDNWWRPGRSGGDLRAALSSISRYIASPRVAKHRTFVWLDASVVPDSAVVAITRDDDTTFGILHSRFHEAWALRLCTFLGVGNDPRYTPSTTFETFPFPEGLTPDVPAAAYADDPRAQAVAAAAARLDQLRRNWLNPADLVEEVPEVVPGFPPRLLPKDEAAAKELKKRTLTNLYNARPAWLAQAHAALDAAVAAAYGWPADISEDEALARLLDINRRRSGTDAAEAAAPVAEADPVEA
ncbi:MAG: class I SAM-dependent DNA methyltransferase [Caenispirillum sp.]|nr:class I SAM-dependent DNA methyltransferase [Caenispirillum sp.]